MISKFFHDKKKHESKNVEQGKVKFQQVLLKTTF